MAAQVKDLPKDLVPVKIYDLQKKLKEQGVVVAKLAITGWVLTSQMPSAEASSGKESSPGSKRPFLSKAPSYFVISDGTGVLRVTSYDITVIKDIVKVGATLTFHGLNFKPVHNSYLKINPSYATELEAAWLKVSCCQRPQADIGLIYCGLNLVTQLHDFSIGRFNLFGMILDLSEDGHMEIDGDLVKRFKLRISDHRSQSLDVAVWSDLGEQLYKEWTSVEDRIHRDVLLASVENCCVRWQRDRGFVFSASGRENAGNLKVSITIVNKDNRDAEGPNELLKTREEIEAKDADRMISLVPKGDSPSKRAKQEKSESDSPASSSLISKLSPEQLRALSGEQLMALLKSS